MLRWHDSTRWQRGKTMAKPQNRSGSTRVDTCTTWGSGNLSIFTIKLVYFFNLPWPPGVERCVMAPPRKSSTVSLKLATYITNKLIEFITLHTMHRYCSKSGSEWREDDDNMTLWASNRGRLRVWRWKKEERTYRTLHVFVTHQSIFIQHLYHSISTT
jgi:hypothetical protein